MLNTNSYKLHSHLTGVAEPQRPERPWPLHISFLALAGKDRHKLSTHFTGGRDRYKSSATTRDLQANVWFQ